MEITPLELYLILKLDNIRALCGVLFVISVILCMYFTARASDDPLPTIYKKSAIAFGITSFMLVTAAFMTPSTKDILLIKTVPHIINSPELKEVSKDTKEVYRLLITRLKKELEEDNEPTENTK